MPILWHINHDKIHVMKERIYIKGVALALCFMFVMTMMSSCSKSDDYSFDDDGDDSETVYYQNFTYTDGSTGKYARLSKHTSGYGFPIIIMADGYTQSEIDNGSYHTAVEKAVTSIFSLEPMASLKEYCDVYEVVAASDNSGITTTKQNTAFSTYFKSSSGVEIDGDDKKIQHCAWYALGRSNDRLANAVIVVLVNSDRYAGITYMAVDETVTDSVGGGLSLAYVPTGCKSSGKSYFTEVLCHEAVGHGIGKLHDEYYSNHTEPTDDEIIVFKKRQGEGLYLNVKYDADTDNDYVMGTGVMTQGTSIYKIMLGAHNMRPGELGYRFAVDAGYAGEELMWTQGAATYLNLGEPYDGALARYSGYYWAAKNFYRPTWGSIMNSVYEDDGDTFNVLSRYIIYARIMKVAQGGSENIHSEALQERFMQFDKLYNISAASAKGMWIKNNTVSSASDLPQLPAPKIMKMESF